MNLLTFRTVRNVSAFGLGGLLAVALAAEVTPALDPVLSAQIVAAVTAAVIAQSKPVDWVELIKAIGAGVAMILAPILLWMQTRQAKAIEETKVAVNGGMAKLTEAKVEEARAKATLEADAAHRAQQGVADAATLKEQLRVAAAATPQQPVVTPAPENPLTGNVPAAEVHVTKSSS